MFFFSFGCSRKRASKWDTPALNTGSATEAAREAARKLNAMLAAKGKLTTNATPPLLVCLYYVLTYILSIHHIGLQL